MTTPHRTNWTQAQATIKAHGHWADITVEGLLAKSDAVDRTQYETCSYRDASWMADGTLVRDIPDVVFEDFMVFPIDDDGKVDSRLVRQWLGY